MARPTIAFLTDFGTRDHYAGAMKGAALTVCPDATLVDITHDIAPQDVLGGALELAAAYPYFPEGTIFVVVVDPGVGSGRRGLATAGGGFHFVAPDNGLLTIVLRHLAPVTIVELTAPQYARSPVSRTFEARDRFAPAAGWLAAGVPLSALGRRIHDPIELALPVPSVSAEGLRGEVLKVDRFGNLVTSIDRRDLDRFAGGAPVRIAVGAGEVARLVDTYADARARQLCALIGSSGYLEIAVSGGNAADRLGLARGAPVVVSRG